MTRTVTTTFSLLLLATCACSGGDGDATTETGACSYSDAGNGEPISADPGGVLIDSTGAAYDVAEDCTLTPQGAAASAVSDEWVATCEQIGGTVASAVDNGDWSCTDIPLGDSLEVQQDVEDLFVPLCARPSLLTSGVLSEGPYVVGFSCSPPADFVSAELASTCEGLGGTIADALGDDQWTCADVPYEGSDERYVEIDGVLAPFCTAPAQFTSGVTREDPPEAGWSCTPA